MSTYYLRGAIFNGKETIFTARIDDQNFNTISIFSYLSLVSNSLYDVVLAPDNAVNNINPSLIPAIFTLETESTGLVFSVIGPSGSKLYLGIGDDSRSIATPTKIYWSPMQVVSPTYNSFGPVLVGVEYAMITTTKIQVKWNIMLSGGGTTNESIPIYFLPEKWYLSGNCSNELEGFTNLTTEEQSFTSDPKNFDMQGFVTLDDCQGNIFYNYCSGSATCGDSNCKGLCGGSDTGQTCSLVNQKFTCTTTQTNGNPKPWYYNVWVWVIVGVVIAVIFILILIFSK